VNLLQKLWRRILRPDAFHRIANFDSDLKLDVNMGETMGVILWHIPQRYEPAERKLFCAAIKPGCTVLDVGANIGVYTLLAAKRGARVFAIEADPLNVVRLRHHLRLNELGQRVTIVEAAALDREGPVFMRRNPNNCAGSAIGNGPIPLQGQTIDSLKLPPIDVCKMDIEGKELNALRGMAATMKRSPQMKLLIEYNCLSDQPALLAFLRTAFTHIAVAGRKETTEDLPLECNLWCWNH
jgi:FkbM family methyltransferase